MLEKMSRLVRSGSPSSIDELISRADALRDERDWPNAAAAYAKAVGLAPNRAPIWVQYGHALKESGDVKAAEAAYRRAIDIDEGMADSHLQLGHLLKITNRWGEATDAYMRALELDHLQTDALREIQGLASRGISVPAHRLESVMDRLANLGPETIKPDSGASFDAEAVAAVFERLRKTDLKPEDVAVLDRSISLLRALPPKTESISAEIPDSGLALVFDASDLVHHFRHSRIPTGIQRVQLEIIRAIAYREQGRVEICTAFHERWAHIPTRLFLALINLATSGSDSGAPEWRLATSQLEIALASDRKYQFPLGACLISLGTSWQVDHLLKIRNAKRDHHIRFIPFVHDLIPIVAPQFVVGELTRDYIGWLLAIFDHADLFLTNSNSTRADLIAAAARLGHSLREDDVVVIPLDAKFSRPADTREITQDLLRARGLYGQPFALFVSTIEPRKNHLAAINAWAGLLSELGARLPKLVCVGGRGWMNDDVFQRVAADEELARHVLFLHGLSDAELAACYEGCLFTLFPSHYEGWGLPVTESLCHGKVPVLSDSSSLPEAGGPFAVYFEAGSQPALVEALRDLITNADQRLGLERKITSEFRPRSWREVGDQISAAIVQRFAGSDPADDKTGIAHIELGSFYSFGRNTTRRLRPGLVSGEALRAGTEWHTPEDWGVWAKSAAVEIRGRFPTGTPVRVHIGISGVPGAPTYASVTINGREYFDVRIAAAETKWLPATFVPEGDGVVSMTVSSDRIQNLGSITDGGDSRTVGLGLRGFYACAAADIKARLNFAEALAGGILTSGAWTNETEREASKAAQDAILAQTDAGDVEAANTSAAAGEMPDPDIGLQPSGGVEISNRRAG